jgi:hypothetical protein
MIYNAIIKEHEKIKKEFENIKNNGSVNNNIMYSIHTILIY